MHFFDLHLESREFHKICIVTSVTHTYNKFNLYTYKYISYKIQMTLTRLCNKKIWLNKYPRVFHYFD